MVVDQSTREWTMHLTLLGNVARSSSVYLSRTNIRYRIQIKRQARKYRTEQNRTFMCKDLYIYTSSYKTFKTTIYT